MRFINEPTSLQLRTYSTNIRDTLTAMKRKAEGGLNPAVDMVTVTTGCNHGCRFCFANAVPRSKGQDITVDVLRKASATVKVRLPLSLTGGEPLDHPHIAAMARSSPNITIPFTNGFSIPVTSREREILSMVAPLIGAISFSVHDHKNPGRDEVIKFFLICGHTPMIQFLAEPGKEKELFSGWADLLLRLLDDRQLQAVFAHPVISQSFYSLVGVYPVLTGEVRAIYRSGRGVNLQGTDLEPLSFNSFSVRKGILESLNYTHLLPDGRLAPSFLACHTMRDPRTQILAHIDDPVDQTTARLKDVILTHISTRLDRSDAQFEQEVRDHFECLDVRLATGVDFFMALLDPQIKAKLMEVKRRMASLLGVPSDYFETFVDKSEATIRDSCSQLIESSKANGLYYLDDPFSGES